jgi:hypothetical protein
VQPAHAILWHGLFKKFYNHAFTVSGAKGNNSPSDKKSTPSGFRSPVTTPASAARSGHLPSASVRMQKCLTTTMTRVPTNASFLHDTLFSCTTAIRDAHNVSWTTLSANGKP